VVGQWTWVSGSNVEGASGTYGTQATAASGNAPGARQNAVGWIDGTGNVWLFGGNAAPSINGNSASQTDSLLNDLWEYTTSGPNPGEWTWQSGANTTDTAGTTGPAPQPGARSSGIAWLDLPPGSNPISQNNGNLWFYGGYGYSTVGTEISLNDDVWFTAPSSPSLWTQVTFQCYSSECYPNVGAAPASQYLPGTGHGMTAARDVAGNVWMFGGYGFESGGASAMLDDLWEFTPNASGCGITAPCWAWVSGPAAANPPSTPTPPTARLGAVSWIDSSGNFWLFGGQSYSGNSGLQNDLWMFDTSNKTWTQVGGSSTANAAGVYGTLGVKQGGNGPGARQGAVAWVDNSGNFWLFGGIGVDSAGSVGMLNDLWECPVPTGTTPNCVWIWMGGYSTTSGPALYGTQKRPGVTNIPGPRYGAVAQIDSTGKVWLFGGYGLDATGTTGPLNDLWSFEP
jgi:hypothetical protein